MKAMFANLTGADFGGRSKKDRAAARRKWVHALFDEIQVAIHQGDHPKVDYLLAELADATAQRHMTSEQGERCTSGAVPGDRATARSTEIEDFEGRRAS